MSNITFVTPVAPYHADLLPRAQASVQAQSVECAHVIVEDVDGKGPAWARNRGLEQVKTPFVVFLDADDWVEPEFAAQCLAHWEPKRYVYTDWYVEQSRVTAPGNPWCDDLAWHVITALIPKYAVDEVGGFRDGPGEDTEFYWALTRRVKCCGLVLHEPLFHYGKEGQRAKATWDAPVVNGVVNLAKSPAYQTMMREIVRSYGNMGCCSDQIIKAREELVGGEPGDVLAKAIWGGNKQVLGSISGRLYPRNGNGRLMMVDPRDAQARPDLWQVVDPRAVGLEVGPPQPEDTIGGIPVRQVENFEELIQAMFPGARRPQQSLSEMQAVEPAQVQPDVRKIEQLARGLYD